MNKITTEDEISISQISFLSSSLYSSFNKKNDDMQIAIKANSDTISFIISNLFLKTLYLSTITIQATDKIINRDRSKAGKLLRRTNTKAYKNLLQQTSPKYPT